jgi:aryl-alcohol dehydrogenase-like predicted oxidoreductase
MEERPFGKIGVKFPILSFGGQRVVDGHGCSESQALKIMNHALDRGIRYFDTAWVYSGGQSEERVGKVAKHRRKEMWIATKTITRTARESRLQLEESLHRLQTDHVDEWRLHNIWSLEELDKVTRPGGSLEAAIQAREKGLVKYISISGHSNPGVQVEALNRFPFDSVLCAVSALDHFILSFAEEFLPIANARGVATIGMKVMGLGTLAPFAEKALRYTLGLPVSTAIVGMETMEQLEKNLAVAENFKPLTDEERLEFLREIMPLVTPQKVMWKAEDWEKPTSWKRR